MSSRELTEEEDRKDGLFNFFYDRGDKPPKNKDPERFGPLIGYSILAAMSVGCAVMLGAPLVAPYIIALTKQAP
jgi:hypothetical protein